MSGGLKSNSTLSQQRKTFIQAHKYARMVAECKRKLCVCGPKQMCESVRTLGGCVVRKWKVKCVEFAVVLSESGKMALQIKTNVMA